MKLLVIILTFILYSCGQTTEEEVTDAVEEANLLLSSYKCDEALAILNAVGMQNTNKKYLDFTMVGTGTSVLGYSNDKVNSAVKKINLSKKIFGLSFF